MKKEYDEEMEELEFDAPVRVEDLIKARKMTMADIRDHLSGPTLSIIVHIVLLAFLSTIIVMRREPSEATDLVVEMIKMEPPPKIDPPEIIPHPDKTDPTVETPVESPTPEVDQTVTDIPDAQPMDNVQQPSPPEVPLPLMQTPSAKVLPFPPGIRSRGEGKGGLIGKHHGGGERGTREILDAITRGLRWLKDHQNEDGSWGDTDRNNYSAYTGLALLAFLGYGATPAHEEFGRTIIKAIKRLVADLGLDGNGVKGGYRHAIALYALSEAYEMTQIPMLEDVLNKGVAKIVAGQNPMGSFNYGYDNSKGRCDLSVSGWNYQALKSAFAAGCSTPGLEEALAKSVDIGLKKTHFAGPGFKYTNDHGMSASMTAVGTLCIELMEGAKTPEAQSGLQILERPENFWCSWEGRNGQPNPWSLYQWYYQTQAIFQGHAGRGPSWRKWDKAFSTAMIKNQFKDGRWESPAYKSNLKKGGEGKLAGLDQPVYATSLCCLTLEVYFRYLPSYHVTKPKLENDGKDALGLEI